VGGETRAWDGWGVGTVKLGGGRGKRAGVGLLGIGRGEGRGGRGKRRGGRGEGGLVGREEGVEVKFESVGFGGVGGGGESEMGVGGVGGSK